MNCNKKVKFEIATIMTLEEHQPKDSSWDVAAATDAKKMLGIILEFFYSFPNIRNNKVWFELSEDLLCRLLTEFMDLQFFSPAY